MNVKEYAFINLLAIYLVCVSVLGAVLLFLFIGLKSLLWPRQCHEKIFCKDARADDRKKRVN